MALSASAKNLMLVELGSVALYAHLLDSNNMPIGTAKAITWGSTAVGSPTGRKIDISASVQWDITAGVWPRYIVIANSATWAGSTKYSDQEPTGVTEAYPTDGTLTLTNFIVTLL